MSATHDKRETASPTTPVTDLSAPAHTNTAVVSTCHPMACSGSSAASQQRDVRSPTAQPHRDAPAEAA